MEFHTSILNHIKNGAIVVSGSRSLKGTQVHFFADKVCQLAVARGWSIIVGDAIGVDTIVVRHAQNVGITPVILGCSAVGKIRMNFHPLYAYTQLINGGTRKSCFFIRDKALIELALKANKQGFMALWDGKSKGTRHTADYAKKKGIAGIIFNPNGSIVERWET